MVFNYPIFNLVVLIFLKLTQSCCSDKLAFLLWCSQIRFSILSFTGFSSETNQFAWKWSKIWRQSPHELKKWVKVEERQLGPMPQVECNGYKPLIIVSVDNCPCLIHFCWSTISPKSFTVITINEQGQKQLSTSPVPILTAFLFFNNS